MRSSDSMTVPRAALLSISAARRGDRHLRPWARQLLLHQGCCSSVADADRPLALLVVRAMRVLHRYRDIPVSQVGH